MIQEYTIFTGCSFTEGIGLPDTVRDENLWVNKLYNSSDLLLKTKLLNLGVGGSNNIEIFMQSLSALNKYNCKYLFVAWTALYRYRFSAGVEPYDVSMNWAPHYPLVDVRLNPDITYSKKYLSDIKNKFFALHHDHAEIVKVLKYTAIINQLCQQLGVNVFFVNNLLPWDRGYFDYISVGHQLPSNTTTYTQTLLNSDTRSDQEFFNLYNKIHSEYRETQGINECTWLNLDSGFNKDFFLDLGNDNRHPGVLSHSKFSEFLIMQFKKITDNRKS